MSRRRSIQRGGNALLSGDSARSGHGRRRKLKPIRVLEGRINDAYTTLNHQLSKAVVEFACNHGAGTIQIEDLSGLGQELPGTFLGMNWRRHQLQQFIRYKAADHGITVRDVDPRYTSRRCSDCGFVHLEFSREFRDQNRRNGMLTRFKCPRCDYEADPDYNAARNLATIDISQRIEEQLKAQLGGSLES